jgi:hypothetical protein
MFSLTTSWMPHASSMGDSPTRVASRSTAARAAAMSTRTSPPAK